MARPLGGVVSKYPIPNYFANLHKTFCQATFREVQEGMEWYNNAGLQLASIMSIVNIPYPNVAYACAALSPLKPWQRNIAMVREYVKCYSWNFPFSRYPRETFTNNCRMAFDCLRGHLERLHGCKVLSFAHALCGDKMAVTIDGHMLRAANYQKPYSPRRWADYEALTAPVHRIARMHGISPRDTQAIIWIVARNQRHAARNHS